MSPCLLFSVILLFPLLFTTAFVLQSSLRSYQHILKSNRYALSLTQLQAVENTAASFSTSSSTANNDESTATKISDTDVVIIGAGLAGLSCGALLAHAGYKVTVLESHDTPGGCCHTWERSGYHFESGPSLYSGFSIDKSPNPLKNIFQIIDEEPEWITYDRWGTVLPEGKFAAKIGPEEFTQVLYKFGGGQDAVDEWNRLMNYMTQKGGLSEAAQATPSLALREDYGAIITLLTRYARRLLTTVKKGSELNESFSTVRDKLQIKNAFVLNWLDMLCFLLQGLPAEGTMNAVIAYMLADWYRPGVTLDFPKGGSGAIVDALVRGIVKHKDCHVITRKHVTQVLSDERGEASGVEYRDERTKSLHKIQAKVAVVSNIDIWHTRQIVPTNISPAFDEMMSTILTKTPKLASFIHLHAGIDATGLPLLPTADFPTQWAYIKDWNLPQGVEAPRNVVLVSMPSLIDPTLAPSGKHVIHAYTPATEPYEDWKHLDRKSDEYKLKKAEAADFLWSAVEQYIPDARSRSDKRVEQIGTPLTHQRFLRRSFGTYGPRIKAGTGDALPGHKTPLKRFWMVGDFTFPGIGVPAAASSGAIAANSIMTVGQHLKLLDKIRLPDFPSSM